ncbi:unnamed protein product [Musa textilis]
MGAVTAPCCLTPVVGSRLSEAVTVSWQLSLVPPCATACVGAVVASRHLA